MNYKELRKSINEGVKSTIEAFNTIERQSDGTVNRYVDLLCAPHQTEGIQLAHKLRNTMQSIKAYEEGLSHLSSEKYPAMAKYAHDELVLLISEIDKIDTLAYKRIYTQIASIIYK